MVTKRLLRNLRLLDITGFTRHGEGHCDKAIFQQIPIMLGPKETDDFLRNICILI